MISDSAQRVEQQTSPESNQAIHRQMEMRIAYFASHPDEIPDRLRELDREWDVERMLETGSSSLTLLGLTLTVARGRRWVLLPILVQGFFLQHALQGWCPPLVLLRRLGFRTRGEIEMERYALKAVRGDFQDLPRSSENRGTTPVMQAVKL